MIYAHWKIMVIKLSDACFMLIIIKFFFLIMSLINCISVIGRGDVCDLIVLENRNESGFSFFLNNAIIYF